LAARRKFFAYRMVVFYCDLGKLTSPTMKIPNSLKVERLMRQAELSPQDLEEMTSFWNPKLAQRNVNERFTKGASLWLLKSEGSVAGYGWTLQGHTIESYYFPLGPKDIQLFDFYVFPKFRGKAMHWLLTAHILQTLAAEGGARAFADTGEWNHAQLASFKLTPFRRLGLVRTFGFFGETFISWVGDETVEQVPRGTEQRGRALAPAGPHD
jgi:hypothetical protein